MEWLQQDDLTRLLATPRELYTARDLAAFISYLLSILPQLVPTEISGYVHREE
jgi:hypothetical protein